jgi:signal transduction histidine kinase
MKIPLHTYSLASQLLVVFICTAAFMFMCEVAKSVVLGPELSLWQSHSITIVVAASLATVISVLVRKAVNMADKAVLESEEKLMRSEAKSILSTLTASVSHELNTPIGTAVVAATSLSGSARDFRQAIELGNVKRSELESIVAGIEEGAILVERNLSRAQALLTSFRQVSADQASEQRRQFDLAEIIQDVLFTLGASLSRASHRIVTHIPPGIIMDSQPGPLEQIVINLINNAYLHAFEHRQDGVLTIAASIVDDVVKLSVSDNGVGMGEETVRKMFEPFFSTKIGSGGTGLGMAIVENLVKKLGGTIEVHSKLGEGTGIIISIPQTIPIIVKKLPVAAISEAADTPQIVQLAM